MDIPVEQTWNKDDTTRVAHALGSLARSQPNDIAIHHPGKGFLGKEKYQASTWQELNELSERYARVLRDHGITAGTRVALAMTPGPDFLALLFALFRSGSVPALVDPAIDADTFRQCLTEAAPAAFFVTTRTPFARKSVAWAKECCELQFSMGGLGVGGIDLAKLLEESNVAVDEIVHSAKAEDPAVIVFTAGTGGAPRAVVYRHHHLDAQASMLKNVFGAEPGEVCLAAYPLFALTAAALGLTIVVPPFDPARPAEAEPEKLQQVINDFAITHLFASPGILDALATYCTDNRMRLESVTNLVSAGSGMPVETLQRVRQSLYRDARIQLLYGAAECQPIANVTAARFDDKLVDRVESGAGICVGRPVEPVEVRIVRISDMVFTDLSETTEMPLGMPGEIVVCAPNCAEDYRTRDAETPMPGFSDERGRHWHRTGDVGILDDLNRLWYCGRVSQRIETGQETVFPEQCEAVFDQHPDLRRSAVVGVGPRGRQTPVLCIEVKSKLSPVDTERVHFDLLQLAQAYSTTRSIRTVLFHPGFPVGTGYGSQIRRDEIAEWAAKKLQD